MKKIPRIIAWYLQDDYTSYYGFKESMIIIQPSTHLLHKSLALKLGMNIIYKSEGEERTKIIMDLYISSTA